MISQLPCYVHGNFPSHLHTMKVPTDNRTHVLKDFPQKFELFMVFMESIDLTSYISCLIYIHVYIKMKYL